jgi:hypothetical protein
MTALVDVGRRVVWRGRQGLFGGGSLGRRRWIWRRPGVVWRWRPGRGAVVDSDGEGASGFFSRAAEGDGEC